MNAQRDLVAQQVVESEVEVKLKALELCADYSTNKENQKLPDSLKKMCDAQFAKMAER